MPTIGPHSTKHEVIYSEKDDWVEDADGTPWLVAPGAKELLKCRGCDSLSLHEWQGDDRSGKTETYYPPRVSRRHPSWLRAGEIGAQDYGLLIEIYTALHADSRRLAMMGCRTMIDVLMNRAVGDIGGFNKKLAAMLDKQLLSKSDKSVLEAAVDAGSAAAHRAYLPTPDVVTHVISIVEHMIHATLIQQSAEEVRRTTPPREKQ